MDVEPGMSAADAVALVADESASAGNELLAVFEGAASLWLEWIEEEAGPGSPVLLLCREVWRERVENARVSIEHADVGNAARILHRGLSLLAHGPQILARKELTLAELEPLLRGF
jgi:hypothetical protein